MRSFFLFVSTVVLASIPVSILGFAQVAAAGQEYVPLVPIPGVTYGTEVDMETYLNVIYVLAISIAAFIAVIKIVLAGFLYIGSDVITTKEDAKKNIRSAITGLFIILAAVLILRTINPAIVNLPVLPDLSIGPFTVVREPEYECDTERLTTGTGCVANNETVGEMNEACDEYLFANGYASNTDAGLGRVGQTNIYRCYTGEVDVPGEDDEDLADYQDILVDDVDVLSLAERRCRPENGCKVWFVIPTNEHNDELEALCKSRGEFEIVSDSGGTEYYSCQVNAGSE